MRGNMEVNSATSQKTFSPIEKQQAEIRAKLAAKFGNKVLPKQKEDKAEISVKAQKRAEPGDEDFADVKNNNPNSEETREKLKALLKTGAFHFNDKERGALSEILK